MSIILLTHENITKHVCKVSAGSYILMDLNRNIKYVGRSDSDVGERIRSHFNEYPYRLFSFWYAKSAKEAFGQECYLYHRYAKITQLDNKIHPDSPDNMDLQCPYCN